MRQIGGAEWQPSEIGPYEGVAVDASGQVYVANARDSVIEVYSATAKLCGTLAAANFTKPWRLALGNGDRLYVLDGSAEYMSYMPEELSRCVHVLHRSNGAKAETIPTPLGLHPTCITVGPTGSLLVGGFHLG